MTDQPLQKLSPEEAQAILHGYVQRNFGADAQVTSVSYRDDYRVWECWVAGVPGYVKAYIVRLAPSDQEWICRHITVMDQPPQKKGDRP